MVTRKPVPSTRQPAVEQSSGGPLQIPGGTYAPQYTPPVLESQDSDPGWGAQDDSRNEAPELAMPVTLPPTYETEDVAPGANTQAWRVNDPRPPIPSLAASTKQAAASQDNGDLGIGGLTVSGQLGRAAGDNVNQTNQTNPFLRKRSSPSNSVLSPESSAQIWDEPTASSLPSLQSPQSQPIPQQSLLDMNNEDPWGDFASATEDFPSAYTSGDSKGKAPAAVPPLIDVTSPSSNQIPDSEDAAAKAEREKNEGYQIKHIRWFDAHSSQNPRQSPILIQNANGPCPLLALVNALVLSTPAEVITPLVETLRTREQVSLGLLLDAVFDELMSERRSGKSPNLPDVGDLYAFLVTLHTGMNVNPRFVPPIAAADSDAELPGFFEDTREMKLYSTFAIPLIHGWIPHRHELAYGAFQRTAQSYEDAQNVQFREEDLEQKLTLGVINDEDQETLKDLTIIKQFFSYWPTQLTAHGLDAIQRYVQPGQVAILFRNDHFSMIYCEPTSSRLMTLVTDAGYATHDEIVWESLVDINGSNAEWYSGDFRSVSHDAPLADDEGWETVESKQGSKRRAAGSASQNYGAGESESALGKAQEAAQYGGLPDGQGISRSAAEQQDHDLALALQLQEEEEERHRNEMAARRAHENDLSEQYISQQEQAGNSGLRIPPRRSGLPQQTTPAPQRIPVATGDEETAPPPYEQAASGEPFIPPRSHPSSEHAARSPPAAMPVSDPSGNVGRRRQGSRPSVSQVPTAPPRRPVAVAPTEKEEKCVVM